jgi:dipeptidyl aminopeptidase/acylaminoacyl peptidase
MANKKLLLTMQVLNNSSIRNNKFYFFISFLLLALNVQSQDGKIVSQTPYIVADSSIKQREKIIPDLRAIIDSVDFFSITYLSDGLKIKGYLSVPKKAGKYPAVIFNRGGNRESSALSDPQIIRFLGLVAGWGYVCIASQYRGNGGSEGKEEFGGKEVNDILNLIPCLSTIDKADTSRIGMWGWSRGGMMTYLALTKTNKIKAAVVGSGMADPFIQTKKRPEMDSVFAELAPGYWQNRDSVLKTRGAVYWADKICMTTPLLLLTGSADWRVPPEEQLEMVNKLYEIKHPLRFEFFEGGQHSLIEHFDEVNHATKTFFDRYVRDKKPFPSLEPHGK